MKFVEWWIAKIDGKKSEDIDLWEQFKTENAARKYIKDDGKDTPFSLVKLTYEVKKI